MAWIKTYHCFSEVYRYYYPFNRSCILFISNILVLYKAYPLTLTALFFVTLGLLGMLVFPESIIGMLSYGFLAFGIAYICVVRSAIEMFEHHRLDREKINQI